MTEGGLRQHAREMAARIMSSADEQEVTQAAEEALRAVIAYLKLTPEIQDVLGIRELRLQLAQQPEESPVDITQILVDQLRETLRVRTEVLKRSQLTADAFIQGLDRAVREKIEAFRTLDAPPEHAPKRRPIFYGRPGEKQPPSSQPRAA